MEPFFPYYQAQAILQITSPVNNPHLLTEVSCSEIYASGHSQSRHFNHPPKANNQTSMTVHHVYDCPLSSQVYDPHGFKTWFQTQNDQTSNHYVIAGTTVCSPLFLLKNLKVVKDLKVVKIKKSESSIIMVYWVFHWHRVFFGCPSTLSRVIIWMRVSRHHNGNGVSSLTAVECVPLTHLVIIKKIWMRVSLAHLSGEIGGCAFYHLIGQ